MEKQYNVEIDTTKFVNIYDKKFVFHISGQPREVEAGEEKVMPIFVAQLGAKHLVDLILQEKHQIKDTLRDTPLRKSLFAQILPEMAEEKNIKPLSPAEEIAEVKKQIDAQKAMIEALSGAAKQADEKDKKIEELTALVEKLLASKPKGGRPPKVAEEKVGLNQE